MKGPDGMTIKEKMVFGVGVVIIVIITLYPPVQSTVSYQSPSGVPTFRQVVRHEFILTDSVEEIHRSRLILQYLAVLIITASIMVILFFTRKQTDQRLSGQVAELAAVNKKLRHKLNELNQSDRGLKEDQHQLEQHIEQKSRELAAANENLQQQVSEYQQAIDRLQQQLEDKNARLSEAGDQLEQQKEEYNQLQQQIAEHKQAEESLNEQASNLFFGLFYLALN